MTEQTGGRRVVVNMSLSLDGHYAAPDDPQDMGWVMPYAVTDVARDHMTGLWEPSTTALLGRVNAEGFLGIQAIRRRHAPATSAEATASASAFRLLLQGLLVGTTNPKTIVFFVAILPQFVDYHRAGVPGQIMLLGLIFTAIAFTCDSIWALTAGTARAWFARSPRRMSQVNAAGGGMMVGLGGGLLLTGNSR